MKTVSSVFAAALSLTAVATTASAMPHFVTFDGLMRLKSPPKLNPATSGAGFARAAPALPVPLALCRRHHAAHLWRF